MRTLAIALAFLLSGCITRYPDGLTIDDRLSAAELTTIAAALDEWDTKVAIRLPIELMIKHDARFKNDEGFWVGGRAWCTKPGIIDLYPAVIETPIELYNGFMHELAHIHLGCKGDHRPGDNLMAETLQGYTGVGLDCMTLGRLANIYGGEDVPGVEECSLWKP